MKLGQIKTPGFCVVPWEAMGENKNSTCILKNQECTSAWSILVNWRDNLVQMEEVLLINCWSGKI